MPPTSVPAARARIIRDRLTARLIGRLPTAGVAHQRPATLPKPALPRTVTSGSTLTGEPRALYDWEAAAHTEPDRPQRRACPQRV